MTSTLRFLGGTDTVGDVQVMISGASGRLLFDLGVVGNPGIVGRTTLFNPLLPPREPRVLLDYLRAGMAPLVENLYDATQLGASVAAVTQRLRAPGYLLDGFPLVTDADPATMAVFVSHLHEDHMLLLPFVAADVPVVMSEPGARLHRALVAAGALPPARARITGIAPECPYSVGDLRAEVIEVDHDVPGSAGLLVNTPDGSVAYTGDWRRHGRHPELMEQFAARCVGVDVLVTEASTATSAALPPTTLPNVPEHDVAEAFEKLITGSRRGVYCSFHERNLERQREIQTVAATHGRVLVLSARTYAIWEAASAEGFDELDTSDGVTFWADEAGPAQTRPGAGVTASDVARNPEAFVCEMRRWDRARLLDVAAGPGDLYVHMNGYPHGPADPGWQVLQTWTRQLGVRFEAISSHGHALPADLQWLVDAVRPGLVVPVHTNAPDGFPASSAPVRSVRRGEELTLSGDLCERISP